MLTIPEAWDCLATVPITIRTERLPVLAAVGRTVAQAITLDGDQPPFDRATMDGFAVVLPGGPTFRVVGEAMAGHAWSEPLVAGTAIRIMTGAPAPHGSTVVPLEATDGGAHGQVTVRGPVEPGRNIAWRGEDGRAGAIVLAPGQRLTPTAVAVAVLAGCRDVTVSVPPRLAVITTGDEVDGHGHGAIRDTNGPYLAAFAALLGTPATQRHARDDGVALRAALVHALDDAEIVVTTGGVGPGDKDLVPRLATTLGFQPLFHGVAMQPGKPVFVATRSDGRLLVGLPGNPVSVVATSHVILAPLVRRLLGRPVPAPLRLPLTAPVRSKGRHLLLPAQRTPAGVTPVAWNGSGDLLAAAAGDALLSIPPDHDLPIGALVDVLPYLGADAGDHGALPR